MSRRRRVVAVVLIACVAIGFAWWILRFEHTPAVLVTLEVPTATVEPVVTPDARTKRRLERIMKRPAIESSTPSTEMNVPEDAAVLTGRVMESDGRPAVHGSVIIEGVKGSLRAVGINDAGAYHVVLNPDDYWVHAARWDGPIQVRSGVQRRRLASGEQVVLNFELPAEYSGDLGFVAVMTSDGFEIGWVQAGSSARALGLQNGDIVLAIDGTDTTSLSDEAFERMLVGPEGTEVSLRVRFFDDEGSWEDTVTLQRSGMDGLLAR